MLRRAQCLKLFGWCRAGPNSGWVRVGTDTLDAKITLHSDVSQNLTENYTERHLRFRLRSSCRIVGSPAGTRTGRYASAARAFISPTAFEQARGGALGAGEAAGSCSRGRPRHPGLRIHNFTFTEKNLSARDGLRGV